MLRRLLVVTACVLLFAPAASANTRLTWRDVHTAMPYYVYNPSTGFISYSACRRMTPITVSCYVLYEDHDLGGYDRPRTSDRVRVALRRGWVEVISRRYGTVQVYRKR